MKPLILTLIEMPSPILPMGGACIAGVLEKNGWDPIHLIEFTDGPNLSSQINAIADKINFFAPEVVGFSCISSNRDSVASLARKLKASHPEIILVAGGPDIHPTLGIAAHKQHMDYLVQGDGEKKILRLLEALKNRGVYEGDEAIFPCADNPRDEILSGHRERIEDLDSLPAPFFGMNPRFERFCDVNGFFAGIPVCLSRGCTGRCDFCNRNEYYRKYRHRSAQNVFEEIKFQMKRYRVGAFIIIDDDPLARPNLKEVEKLAGLLTQNQEKWRGQIYNARISRDLLQPGLAEKLRAAGFERIQFGVESFSPAVRKHMGKPSPAEVVDQVLETFSRAGISTGIYLIYGYPQETDQDFALTLEGLERHAGNLGSVNVNCFYLNTHYMQRKPGNFTLRPPPKGQRLCFWESPSVNARVLASRHQRIRELIQSRFPGFYYLEDTDGQCESRLAANERG